MHPIDDDREPVSEFPIAIVQYTVGEDVDKVLSDVAIELKRDRLNIAGFLQREDDSANSACCSDMYLEDIGSGSRFRITQSLGSGSQGCRLDPNGLVEAVSYMASKIDSKIDLLILNRFGKGEEEGRGFRPVIEAAFMLDIPTLIIVRDDYLEAWRQFVGGEFTALPADKKAVLAWSQRRISQMEKVKAAV